MIRRLFALALLLPSIARAACSATDAYSTAVCADSPAVYLRLNDIGTISNTTIADASGNNCTGNYSVNTSGDLVGSQTGIPDAGSNVAVNNTAAHTSYGNMGTCDSSWSTSGGITVEAWIKKTVNTNGAYAVSAGGNSSWSYSLAYSTTDFSVFQWDCPANNTSALHGTTTPTVGTYYHVVATINGATSTAIFVNGAQENSTSSFGYTPCTATSGYNKVLWARGDFTNVLNGTLDEVAIYRGILSGTRILAHYTAGSTAPTPSPGMPFSVKRDRLPRPWTTAPEMPQARMDLPGFLIDRMNRAMVRTASVYR